MLKNGLLLIVSLLVALLLGEVMLRVLGYDPAFINPLNSFHQADAELGWVGVPGFSARFEKTDFDVKVRTNSQGFRAKTSKVQPKANARDILFLGDSFTWGWGVNNGELFTDRLQVLLGADYDIQNYGVNAYGSVQELLLFKRLLAHGKAPESVYLMMFNNDFADNLDRKHGSRPYYAVEGGTPILKNQPVENPIGGWVKNLRRQSYVLTFLSYWANYYQASRDQQALQAEVIETDEKQAKISETGYAVMRAVLESFQALSQQHGIALQVVYIPYADDFAQGAPYRQALTHLCAGLGVEFIDLTPQFAEHPGEYYFAHDEHWTPDGHALAADVLRQHIKQQQTFTPRPTKN